jgi:copper chaperone NosL
MKSVLSIALVALLLGCTPKPEPLSYNHDACHACKMTLTDKKYGAEIVTKKNKVYKFDDINCMVNFLNSGDIEEGDVAFKLVIDYSNPDRGLIAAEEAFYLFSDQLRSPMASEVAAFEKQDSLKKMKTKIGGIYLAWGELKTQFK